MQTNRQDFWESEYKAKDVPSSRTFEPSGVLKKYVEGSRFFKYGNTAVDLGAGNLRNSIYLAENNFEVFAYEWIQAATNLGLQVAGERGLGNKIKVFNQPLTEKLSNEDFSVDLVIDMMVLHCLKKEEREFISSEIQRVLKPGGIYLLFTIAAEGDQFDKLKQENPGEDENSYRFEHNNFTIEEKAFTKEEIAILFSNLNLVDFERIVHQSNAFGGVFERIYYCFTMQKT